MDENSGGSGVEVDEVLYRLSAMITTLSDMIGTILADLCS